MRCDGLQNGITFEVYGVDEVYGQIVVVPVQIVVVPVQLVTMMPGPLTLS